MTALPFDTKILDPFPNVFAEHLSCTDPIYEKLRKECNFHQPFSLKQHCVNLSMTSSLNIIHLNIRSLVSKLDDLQLFLKSTNVDWQIICLSESWLSKELESLYGLDTYKSFFMSRANKSAGGSAIYIKTGLQPQPLNPPVFKTAEVVCVELNYNQNQKVVVCQVYRAPNTNVILFMEEMERCLSWLDTQRKSVFISGDFNLDLFSINSNQAAQMFFNLMCSFGFLPTISKTTRHTNSSDTLIDNIFSNRLRAVNTSGIIVNDLSDHFPIFASSSFGNEAVQCVEAVSFMTCFDYNKTDDMKHFLRCELNDIQNENNPELIAEVIINAYNKGITLFSYIKKLNRKTTPRKPWITPAILTSINRKNELFAIKLKNNSPENIDNYQTYRNILKTVLMRAKRQYFMNKFKDNEGNMKKTWKCIGELMGKNKSDDDAPEQIFDQNRDLISDNKALAEAFNAYFSEIGVKLKNKIQPVNNSPLELVENIENEMALDPTNADELKEIISHLNNVGAGFDKINSRLFKSTYEHIMDILLHLFNSCLISGIFPSIFKVAVIKPIFKAGDPKELNNYRPISILPFISKVLEQLICNRLRAHLANNSIIHPQQFGFQKNRSTYMPLLLFQNSITKAFEDAEPAVGIFLDLRKAFDTVDTPILLKKLQKYGIRQKSLDIISSYLFGRKQCVKINGLLSSYRDVCIGVPQGSILGPILFILYINDLPKISPKMTCLLYADDTAIVVKEKSVELLQNTVNEIMPMLSKWFSANYLSLNVAKTFAQHYSISSPEFTIKICINGAEITEKEEVKYLGVVIDKSLKFSHHIRHTANIISRNIGIISRIRHYIDEKTTLLLYNTMVLPHLNYCCLIWGVNYASQLQRLTVLQKRAVRLITKIYPPASSEPVFEKHKILKIGDLARIQMVSVMHKFVCGVLPASFHGLYVREEEPLRMRRFPKHIKEPFSNRNYRLFTTTLLGPKLWNRICAPLYPSVDEITRSKYSIKKVCRSHFLDK